MNPFLLLIIILLSACSSSEDAKLAYYIQTVKARSPKPIEPIPQFKPLAKFSYPEQPNRRDPFKPKADETTNNQLAPNNNRPKQFLEQFPLDSLTFMGTIQEPGITWALVKEPQGIISRVKVGDYMGKNYGQVISIGSNSLIIEETIQVQGIWKKQKITLTLNKHK